MTLQNNSSSPSALLFCPHHKLEQMVVAHCWQLGKYVAVFAFIKYSLKCDKISVIKKTTPLRTVEPQQRCGVMTLWWRESQCQAIYCMAMKWRWLKVPTSTGTLFWQDAGAKKKSWLCNNLMPSSAEQIKLSKATTQPPTCPDNRPLDLLKEENIALHSLKLQIGAPLVLPGEHESSPTA